MAYAQKEIKAPKGPPGCKNSQGLLAMQEQSQNSRLRPGHEKLGSPPRALRSYPEHLTFQATKSQDPGFQPGLLLPQGGGV